MRQARQEGQGQKDDRRPLLLRADSSKAIIVLPQEMQGSDISVGSGEQDTASVPEICVSLLSSRMQTSDWGSMWPPPSCF